jgi:hypothetical protein
MGGLVEAWQSKALELFPELREKIEEQINPMGLWIELTFALDDLYEEQLPSDERIGKFYEYAAWCFQQPRTDSAETDLSSAVAVAFIEDIPLHKGIAADLYRWMSVESFDGCEKLFRYHFSEVEFKKFSSEFHAKKKTFKGIPRL